MNVTLLLCDVSPLQCYFQLISFFTGDLELYNRRCCSSTSGAEFCQAAPLCSSASANSRSLLQRCRFATTEQRSNADRRSVDARGANIWSSAVDDVRTFDLWGGATLEVRLTSRHESTHLLRAALAVCIVAVYFDLLKAFGTEIRKLIREFWFWASSGHWNFCLLSLKNCSNG